MLRPPAAWLAQARAARQRVSCCDARVRCTLLSRLTLGKVKRRDFTALGGYAILVTAFVGFAVFAYVELGTRTFHFFWLTTVGGFWTGVLMKRLIQRERPSIVPHLSHVSGNTSFPSSHAMMSVVVLRSVLR